MSVAIVHDYLTQRGGAERVALEMARAFPGAPLYTSLYEPSETYDGFADVDVRPLRTLNRVAPLRRDSRLALPLLPAALRRAAPIEAEVVLCSSSGWGHAFRTTGAKVVYCHNPARWLYQPDAYFGGLPHLVRSGVSAALGPLRRWDRARAAECARYVANSHNVAGRINVTYGLDADVVHPPRGLDPEADREAVPGLEPGFYLTVSRRRGYKRSRDVAEALGAGGRRLVQVGGDEPPPGADVVQLTGVSDAQLRWLYAHCKALVAVGDEDFGLTPVEAYAFGRPVIALAAGGYLETSSPVATVMLPGVDPAALAAAADEVERRQWDEAAIREHGEKWAPATFRRRLAELVAEVAAASR